ncbi:MAG: TolC family protein [Epsilonproteobacteria bacterium]|nr:TolC family protein [Campylobacterota bacterium]
MQKSLFLTSLIAIQVIASDLSLLHPQKKQIQEEKRNEIEAAYQNQKYDWVSPLNLSLTKSKSKSIGDNTYSTVDKAAIGLNQDIFRFGGIYYTLSFADKQKSFELLTWEKENAQLYEQIYTTVLNLRRLHLQLEQAKYRLKNLEIDVFLKREQYKTGSVDMTQLNRAIMDKNDQLKVMINTKESIASTQKTLRALTPLKFSEINIPIFTMIDKKQYLQHNYAINQAALQSDLNLDQYKITKSSYLPHLSINAEVGYQNYDHKTNDTADYDGDYHSTGLSVTMPLDFNTNTTLQEQKAAYLQTKLQIEDEKIAQNAVYEESQALIKNYQEYIEVTRKNLTLYGELITMTKQGFKAGYKSGYDLKTIENTQKIDALEVEINETNIQLELLKLHFAQQQRIPHG